MRRNAARAAASARHLEVELGSPANHAGGPRIACKVLAQRRLPGDDFEGCSARGAG